MPKGPEVLEELEVKGSAGIPIAIVLLKASMRSTRIKLFEVVVPKPIHLAMDNSAARSFLCRVGVGRIRHISLRILWIQLKIEEGFMTVGKVGTKDNVSDLGTKRVTRDRVEYLVYLCKVYNMADSQFVGSSFAERMEEQQVLRIGIKNLL